MPKRTNEFQELVSLIQSALARDGDKVTSPAMVRVHGLETEREIDILYETPSGLVTLKVAYEAKDEGRPMDLIAFESYCAKYRGEGRVAVDKFVIVSRHGFTEGAREKARLMDVPLLTLDEAREVDWSKLGPEHKNLNQLRSLHLYMGPHFHWVRLRPTVPSIAEETVAREGRLICQHGTDHGSPLQWATHDLYHQPTPETRTKLRELDLLAQTNPDGAEVRVTIQLPGYILRFCGKDYPISELEACLHVVHTTGSVEIKPYEMKDHDGQDKLLHCATARLGSRVIRWVMPDGLRSNKIALRIDQEPPNPKQKAAARRAEKKKEARRRKRAVQRQKDGKESSDRK